MSIQNEADTRGLILGLLNEHGCFGVVIKPNDFMPPMDKRDIFRVGLYFHQDGIISAPPSDTGVGYFMQTTLRGQAIWENREQPTLEITVPPC